MASKETCIKCPKRYQVGQLLVPRGFVKCFLRVTRLLGCTAAAMLPKQARGTFRKHVRKPSEHVAASPSI